MKRGPTVVPRTLLRLRPGGRARSNHRFETRPAKRFHEVFSLNVVQLPLLGRQGPVRRKGLSEERLDLFDCLAEVFIFSKGSHIVYHSP